MKRNPLMILLMTTALLVTTLSLIAIQDNFGNKWSSNNWGHIGFFKGGMLPYIYKENIQYDLTTGLAWERCSAGQKFNKGRCIGTAKVLSWDKF
jgi:hypothetical protein